MDKNKKVQQKAHSAQAGLAPVSHQEQLLLRTSFIELSARERAISLLDAGSMRELIDPFERMRSPWLERQGVVTQSDDGVVVAKGTVDGQSWVILAIEGAFQGGSLGEVGGAKIAAALELAAEDNRNGIPTGAAILFETGGVRLQEANLGLAAIAEIHSAIVDLRRYQPVIGISAGTVGCFGGMSIAAALCSYLVVTREARVGLNGPAVIEQEAGIAEYDARDRRFIWSFTGGEQRVASGLADRLVQDDTAEMRKVLRELIARGIPQQHRSDQVEAYLSCLAQVDAGVQATPDRVRQIYRPGATECADQHADKRGVASVVQPVISPVIPPADASNNAAPATGRGASWFAALTAQASLVPGYPASLMVADAELAGKRVRAIAVVPDPHHRFPRVRQGEVGLLEGWQIARAVHEVISADKNTDSKTPIVAVIDVASQAYGRREEAYGIHLALAAAAGAYASARQAGHPVIGLIVGKAMSGAFLAHGYQANRLIALDDVNVMVHAMGKESAARITLRSVEALEKLAASIPPMAYDIGNFASLGLLWQCLTLTNPDQPQPDELMLVQQSLLAALDDIRADPLPDLRGRLGATHRAASAMVRKKMREQWQ